MREVLEVGDQTRGVVGLDALGAEAFDCSSGTLGPVLTSTEGSACGCGVPNNAFTLAVVAWDCLAHSHWLVLVRGRRIISGAALDRT